jgi:hypothetical protein
MDCAPAADMMKALGEVAIRCAQAVAIDGLVAQLSTARSEPHNAEQPQAGVVGGLPSRVRLRRMSELEPDAARRYLN